MTESISIDIPQLPVDTVTGGGTLKDPPPELEDYYINTYLLEKLAQLSTRHDLINAALRNIYFCHQTNLNNRQQDSHYNLNVDHYSELALIENVCFGLHQNTTELLSVIHYMDHLKQNNSHPVEIGIPAILASIKNKPAIWTKLNIHSEFMDIVQQIQRAFTAPFVHSPYKQLLTETDPTVFIPLQLSPENYSLRSISLRLLITHYISFFQSAKNTLKECSPQVITLLANRNL